ncbi:hypothetical protein [Streptomyces parvus]|uniref:hypothetical protein n=1 Tax=Streptomyces parvus TaxID=66428 RepID=UPI00210079EA|nr:hypothetical protein [Streptomyces parvus]MCQ1577184.1 hypothetical protein [Streptomyces parvus]
MTAQPDPVLLTNKDPRFYPTLGPYLARHEVHKALGGVPWDEDTKTWIVLKTASGELRGFCAVNQSANRSRRTMLESLYTLPGHDGATDQLIRTAIQHFGHDRDLHAIVRHTIAPHHEKAGFHTVKTTVNMATLVRRAAIRN